MPVLIVAAHPDDEIIGTGVLAHRLVLRNHPTYVCFTTNGRGATWMTACATQRSRAAKRLAEAQAALAHMEIDFTHIMCLGFPDGGLHRYLRPVLHDLRAIMGQLRPWVVLTHGIEGGHRDHDTTSLLVQLAGAATGIPIVEWAEYNRDFPLQDALIGFPHGHPGAAPEILTMSVDEWKMKADFLAFYVSQPESRCTSRRQEVFRIASLEHWDELLQHAKQERRIIHAFERLARAKEYRDLMSRSMPFRLETLPLSEEQKTIQGP